MLRALVCLAFLCCPLIAFAEDKIQITGPASVAPGDLIILDATGSVIYDAPPLSYRWKLINSSKSFMPVEGGTKVVFSSGTPGDYKFMLVITGVRVKPEFLTTPPPVLLPEHFEAGDLEKTVTVKVEGVLPPPGPTPVPNPRPDLASELGMKKVAYEKAVVMTAGKSHIDEMAANQEIVASKLAAGGYSDIQEAMAELKELNNAVGRKMVPAAMSEWGAWASAWKTQADLTLRTNEQHVEGLTETAAGLRLAK